MDRSASMLSAFSRRLKCCLYAAVSVLYVVRSQGLHKKTVIQENHLALLTQSFYFYSDQGTSCNDRKQFLHLD